MTHHSYFAFFVDSFPDFLTKLKYAGCVRRPARLALCRTCRGPGWEFTAPCAVGYVPDRIKVSVRCGGHIWPRTSPVGGGVSGAPPPCQRSMRLLSPPRSFPNRNAQILSPTPGKRFVIIPHSSGTVKRVLKLFYFRTFPGRPNRFIPSHSPTQFLTLKVEIIEIT